MSSGSRTATAYLVIGLTMETMSTSCTPSWRMPSGLPYGVEHAVGALDLAGEEERGRRVEPGAGDAGDRVGAAGAGGDQGHAETVGGLGVALGAHGGGLLVRVADGRDSPCGERGVEVHGAAAGDEEDVLDALVGDEVEDVVGELHYLHLW